MKRFEYLKRSSLDEEALNKFGLQGWELVGLADNRYILKREIPPPVEHSQGYQERTQNGYDDGYGR
jgi:hypothetical protein